MSQEAGFRQLLSLCTWVTDFSLKNREQEVVVITPTRVRWSVGRRGAEPTPSGAAALILLITSLLVIPGLLLNF